MQKKFYCAYAAHLPSSSILVWCRFAFGVWNRFIFFGVFYRVFQINMTFVKALSQLVSLVLLSKAKKKRNYDSLRCLGAWNFWFLLRPNKSNSIHTVEMIYELNIATIQYLAGKYFNWHWFLPKNNNNTKFCLFKTRNERLL